jgi:cyclic pyranopterin phosphate synthase
MCKAVSHNIVIRETKLTAKSGGKRTVLELPTYGLVLTGGKSERMKTDKALLNYKGLPHAQYIYNILQGHCEEVYLSARKNQWQGTALQELPILEDSMEGFGPIGGILSAFEKHPEANWIVVACDLVHFNEKTVQNLLANFDSDAVATAYRNSVKDFPEPLCTLYTPQAQQVFRDALKNNITCPVKVLKNNRTHLLNQGAGINLANINTVTEFQEVQNEIR